MVPNIALIGAKIFALILQSNLTPMVLRDLHYLCPIFVFFDATIFALIMQSNLHLWCQEICTNGAKEIAATVPRRRDPTGCGVVARLQISPSRKNRHHH